LCASSSNLGCGSLHFIKIHINHPSYFKQAIPILHFLCEIWYHYYLFNLRQIYDVLWGKGWLESGIDDWLAMRYIDNFLRCELRAKSSTEGQVDYWFYLRGQSWIEAWTVKYGDIVGLKFSRFTLQLIVGAWN
jgi:hypothetical protein